MRYIIVLLSCFFSVCLFAQSPGAGPAQDYSGKYYFFDTNAYLFHSPIAAIRDTLAKMQAAAREDGNYELEGGLKLLRYKKEFRERLVSKERTEAHLVELAAYANKNGLLYLEADALQAIGDFYSEDNQQQSAAIENYISAYAIYKNFKYEVFPPKQAYTYTLGGMYYRHEDYDNCIKYLREAMQYKQYTKNNMFCSIFNTVGMSYRQMKMYDSAILYFRKGYDVAVSQGNMAWVGITQGNIGITYFLQKKYAEAIPLLEEDITSSLATTNVQNAVGSMGILASIYNSRNEYDKAEKLLVNGLNLCYGKPFWPNYQLAEQLYTQLSVVYGGKKDYRLAYLYADSAMMAKDSVHHRSNALTLSKAREKQNFIQHKLEAEKLQTQIKIGEVELGKKRVERVFAIIGIVILLLVIIFITRERKRSENLLLNILPEKIAERLKRKEHPIADYFDNASIIFIDMAGFTTFSNGRDPNEIVNILNLVFTRFDGLAEKYGLEKIKTIGDCYMAVSGLPEPNPNHAEAATKMALDIRSEMKGFAANDGTIIEFRIGLDCGPVVAGVIGRRKFIYDLWGDAVNTAARMESTGVAGEIQCTDRFKKIIEGNNHKFTSRGHIEIKGKGVMDTWLILE